MSLRLSSFRYVTYMFPCEFQSLSKNVLLSSQISHDRSVVIRSWTAGHDCNVPTRLLHDGSADSRQRMGKPIDCPLNQCELLSFRDIVTMTTYDWNARFLAVTESFDIGLSDLRAVRYSSHLCFISSDSCLNFSFINSTMIVNLFFSGFSFGCSNAHSFLYLSHSSSTWGFHLFS